MTASGRLLPLMRGSHLPEAAIARLEDSRTRDTQLTTLRG
jgi:hypothetical protein